MGLGGTISNLLSLGAKLLPAVVASAQAPSSSSLCPQNNQIEAELKKLMRMLERIKATLYDAEQREVTDLSVKLWLKELKGVAYDAEDVLDEYHYEVLRAQVEARDASPPHSRERKLIQVPHGMLDQIQQIRSKFDEITNDRIALQLSDGDGPKQCNNELQLSPTSHFVVESNIFGREREKEKLIELLSSECDVVSVVAIVGMGGIGKTTLAQLAYNDQRIRQRFDKFGWICVSENFNVERLTKESVESITEKECGLTNLSALQEKIRKEVRGKRILLVLDDVWDENDNIWDSFKSPFMFATSAKIVVTTRNEPVARIMQTEPTFNLGYLSAEQCWRLFEHYAFGKVQQNKDPKFVEIGKQIVYKCGVLPLVVKSIASLLRHETKEESWREILESELWQSDVRNKIFAPLQISYARLPTYLKPCFLYCSMFPKDHCYDVEFMVKLWMYQGFIESKVNKTAKEVGFEYVQQLCQRSLFEREGGIGTPEFKLHDIVHDLARLNSENGCYSSEVGKLPIFPDVLYHLYIADFGNLVDLIPSDKFTALRTLFISSSVINDFSTFDLSIVPKLRSLQICKSYEVVFDMATEFEFLSSIGNLKHLRFLSLNCLFFTETLPKCICSLYNLQNLTLSYSYLKELPRKIGNLISLEELLIYECLNLKVLPESFCQLKALRKLFISRVPKFKELPNNIGNLVSLEELIIEDCDLEVLPESFCQLKALSYLRIIFCNKLKELPSDMGRLTNLQTLEISNTDVSYLPPGLSKFVGIATVKVSLACETIGWLKDFPNLGGTLCLCLLENISDLMDVQCANLMNMRNLEYLQLDWMYECFSGNLDGSGLVLNIKRREMTVSNIKRRQKVFSERERTVMDCFQPPTNITKLEICGYDGYTIPEWVGSLCKLKYLRIESCISLAILKEESLPLQLEELSISQCDWVVSMPGIQKLKSLVKLNIFGCKNLSSIIEPSRELTMGAQEGSYDRSLLGLTNLVSLRSLEISHCYKLEEFVDALLPTEPCKVEVSHCPGLRIWCLQHGINYKIVTKRTNLNLKKMSSGSCNME